MSTAEGVIGTFHDGLSKVRDMAGWVVDKLQAVTDKLNNLPSPPGWLSDVAGAAGSAAEKLGGLVGIGAEGGIVTRPTMALIGEAGPEAVMPLNKMPGARPLPAMGGSGVTIHNHFTVSGPGMAQFASDLRVTQSEVFA